MWKEFKDFILKGNIFDMAVGVIIGGAFGKIVTSLVDDILMPVIGIFCGGIDFASLKYIITPAVKDASGNVVTPEAALCYGNFIQQIIDFLIIAVCIFIMIKLAATASKKIRGPKEEEPAKLTTEDLLVEIRDIIKEGK